MRKTSRGSTVNSILLSVAIIPIVALLSSADVTRGGPENSETFQVSCVDTTGRPVPNAEVLAYQIEHFQTGEPASHFLPPSRADGEGKLQLRFPPCDDRALQCYREVYARVDGKLVGAGSQDATNVPADRTIPVVMVPTIKGRGRITVPEGFSAAQVSVRYFITISPTESVYKGFGLPENVRNPPGWPDWFSATPDADGRFVLENLPLLGNSYVSATAAGLGEAQQALFKGALDSTRREADFQLSLEPETIITGRLTDPTGAPISGQRVLARIVGARMVSQHQYAAVTDADGQYRIGGLFPDAIFNVWPEPQPSLVAALRTTRLLDAGETQTDFDFQMEPGFVVTGRVMEGATNRAVSGAILSVDSVNQKRQMERINQVRTNSSGEYEVRLPPGETHMSVFGPSVSGYDYKPPSVTHRDFKVGPGELAHAKADFILYPMGAATKAVLQKPKPLLRVKAVDPGGRPLEGVLISYAETEDTETNASSQGGSLGSTKADGTFESPIDRTKSIKICVGGIHHSSVMTDPFDSKTKSEYDLGVFTVRPATATISGKVVDADGAPIPNAAVSGHSKHMFHPGLQNEFTTNTDGAFELPSVLDDETASVSASKEGYVHSGNKEFRPGEHNALLVLKRPVDKQLLGTWELLSNEAGQGEKDLKIPQHITFKQGSDPSSSQQPADIAFAEQKNVSSMWRYEIHDGDLVDLQCSQSAGNGFPEFYRVEYAIEQNRLTLKWWMSGHTGRTTTYQKKSL
jgi:hypothetical protein